MVNVFLMMDLLFIDFLRGLKRVVDSFWEYFIDKLSWMIIDSLVWVGLFLGVGGFDLVFVFDSLVIVGSVNFKKGVEFVKIIIDEFGILVFFMGMRVVVVIFSLIVKVVFNL